MHVEFFGATKEVTGACFLVHVGKHRILIDCGLIQGNYADEQRNYAPFPFNPAQINAVVLSHAHLDHSGRLPLLLKKGFQGAIYTQTASRDLARIMLRDAAFLNQKESEWNNKKRLRKGLTPLTPLYSIAEANVAVRRMRTLPYGQTHTIVPGVSLTLHDAGHILGSSIVELRCTEAGQHRTLVYSGDLGHSGAPILRDPAPIEHADLLLLESTYGNRRHRDWDATWEELGHTLMQAQKGGGNILIPAFAIGRTQELLYLFKRHYQEWEMNRWQIFLDSPLAIEATTIYSQHAALYDAEAHRMHHDGDPFSPPNLHYCKTAVQSIAINRLQGGAIIIAGSGMCDGGRIKHHLKHHLWRNNCHVIFSGFQARGTLGRRIVDGAAFVRLWGETIKVNAQIHTIGGLSAHADQTGLLKWLDGFHAPPRVALVHGEVEAMEGLRDKLHADRALNAVLPQFGEHLDL
ncbi:MAG: MBL fold metallo-hydrolase [Gammaproteobacteria bacterium]|nr:MBL fold metallo-hydrolase [Gammaproteobacteria bacterium]